MSETKVEKVNEDFFDDFFGESTTSVKSEEEIKKEKKAEENLKTFQTSSKPTDLSFLVTGEKVKEDEKIQKVEDEEEEEEEEEETPTSAASTNTASEEEEEEIDTFSVINELISEGSLLGFEDQDIETAEDLRQLIIANIENAKVQPKEDFKNEFFASLPEEVKIVYEYAQKGASQDEIRSLFKSFSKIEETYSLDISTVEGQRSVVKQYLLNTGFGTEEEINQEIEDWEDLDKLEEKANKFKPKLEKLEEKNVAQKLKEQQEREAKQREFQQSFINNIKDATSKPQLVNLKLSKQERMELESNLLNNNYKSDLTGRPLNALGKVLEHISFVEPNPAFLAELTYFATKPEEFIKNLTETIKQKETGNMVKKLKTTTVPKPANAGQKTNKIKYRGINDMN